MAGEADVALEAERGQRVALRPAELLLLPQHDQVDHARLADVPQLVRGLDEVIT
jgi:hypothetical protein